MKSKTVAFLLADLGVTKTHSRPHTSNDNPFSESQFKTLKYRPDFPDRFGAIEDSRVFCQPFFRWYNWEHHHSGIGLLTPGTLHYGLADRVIQQRQQTLTAAYQAHPERFVRKAPAPPTVPEAAWINPPETRKLAVALENEAESGKTKPQDRLGTSFSDSDDQDILSKLGHEREVIAH